MKLERKEGLDMESNMVYNVTIMELIKKEDGKKKPPMVDYLMWRRTLEGMLDVRSGQYPTLSICDECTEDCEQVQVVGLFRFYCGVKGIDWQA